MRTSPPDATTTKELPINGKAPTDRGFHKVREENYFFFFAAFLAAFFGAAFLVAFFVAFFAAFLAMVKGLIQTYASDRYARKGRTKKYEPPIVDDAIVDDRSAIERKGCKSSDQLVAS